MCESDAEITTYAQLRAVGHTRHWISASLDAGVLERIRRGVYASCDPCPAARAAAAHGGMLGCVSAARHLGLWVLDDEDEPAHVWMNRGGHRQEHPGCTCVEHWDEGPDTDAFGVPSVPRVLRQILACKGVETFFVALESALYQHKITRAGLAWLRAHVNDAGRDAMDFARRDAESGLESLLRWRLRRHGLAIAAQVFIVSVGRVDFLIGDRLIVEVDGAPNHDDATHRHKDLSRDANAATWGYITLRFDYAQIVHDWPTVEAAILAQIAAGNHLRH
ncbi:endonuclease domain-containing protein [Microbacterium luticocti]|uniref:endonuclease domain-containing protein n=1 Tax=Microbacterium luticocti TaxID=451764 RepID=UPI00040C0EBA|nr:DUF559 domain-containing protein [Microbacterium luticocti]